MIIIIFAVYKHLALFVFASVASGAFDHWLDRDKGSMLGSGYLKKPMSIIRAGCESRNFCCHRQVFIFAFGGTVRMF